MLVQHVVAARVPHRPGGNGRGHPGATRGWTVVRTRGWTAANATGDECWHGRHRLGSSPPGRSTAPGSTTPTRRTPARSTCGSRLRGRNGPGLSSNTDTSIDSSTAKRCATGSARAEAGAATRSTSPGQWRTRSRWKGGERHIKQLSPASLRETVGRHALSDVLRSTTQRSLSRSTGSSARSPSSLQRSPMTTSPPSRQRASVRTKSSSSWYVRQ